MLHSCVDPLSQACRDEVQEAQGVVIQGEISGWQFAGDRRTRAPAVTQ